MIFEVLHNIYKKRSADIPHYLVVGPIPAVCRAGERRPRGDQLIHQSAVSPRGQPSPRGGTKQLRVCHNYPGQRVQKAMQCACRDNFVSVCMYAMT